jgi:hypothetical protein
LRYRDWPTPRPRSLGLKAISKTNSELELAKVPNP